VGLLVLAVIVGVAFVLTSDDGDDETTTQDDTSTTASDGSSTTAGDSSSDAIVDAMATSLEGQFAGQITRDQAECIAQGFLDAFGLQRLAEFGQGGGDPFANLSPDEQQTAVNAMLECVDAQTLAEIGQSTPG
jgi:hypothetical protein